MFRPRWRKVLVDLWGNKAQTLLVVASIAVGVFAIGVIAGTYGILSEDLNASYAATNPANVSLVTSPFDPGFVDAIERVDGVAVAEGRREVTVRVQVGAGEWDTLKLVAIPDYAEMQIHRLVPSPISGFAEGSTPRVPDDREVALERKTLAKLGAAVGDILTIELADGTVRQIPVAGVALDQSDVYDLILGELRGYVTFDSLEWLHAPASLDRLLVTVSRQPNDEAAIRHVAAEVTDRVERSGRLVFETRTAPRDRHPLDSIIEALLLVLIIVGVLIVFLSGSLIANTMSALLNQQLRQIGVMKLVGARRFQVIGMYVILIMSFGGVALAVAIPLGSWGAYGLSRFAAEIVNFVVRDFRVWPLAVVFQVAIGLLVPPIAGLVPVLRGSRISVRRAISSMGLSDGEGKEIGRKDTRDKDTRGGWVAGWLERVRRGSRPLLVSIRNTFRRKGRLALTLFTLTLGGAVFIAVFNSQASVNRASERTTRYFGADVNLDFAQSYRVEEVIREAMMVPGVERVEVWKVTGAEGGRHQNGALSDEEDGGEQGDKGTGGQGDKEKATGVAGGEGGRVENGALAIGLFGVPADSELIEPKLLAGRWLLPGDGYAIAVNEAFWTEFPDLQVGDRLRLKVAGREDDWTVVGIFQYTGLDDLVAYANYESMARVLKETNHASAYRIVTSEHSLEFQERVGAQLDSHFRDLGFRIKKVEAGKALTSSVSDLLGILTDILLVMAVMTALVGVIGLMGTMSMNVMERTREIGVMRAIGAHNQIVSKLVLVEGLTIGLISYGVGVVLSFPISAVLSNAISVTIFKVPAELVFHYVGFLVWLAAVVVLSVSASVLPARRASRLTIREVLAYE